VGGRGAGGQQWVVRLNLNWGKEAQINVAFTIDKEKYIK
jgi:hypothetical protein